MSDESPPVPADPLEWRPQRALDLPRPHEIIDPVVEPLWSGTRVLAHIRAAAPDAPKVQLVDAHGVDLATQMADLAASLGTAVLAQEAVLDVIVTNQVTGGGTGTAVITEPRASMTDMLLSRKVGIDVQRRGSEPDTGPDAIVAIDLLRLDEQSLLDVPLLERKRLLESVVEQSELVRVSVHTRPPVETWVATWKAAGLRGAMLKAANSRYVPGGISHEWRAVTRLAGRR
jgi:bifunctional non-homologous end joining protein LigD